MSLIRINGVPDDATDAITLGPGSGTRDAAPATAGVTSPRGGETVSLAVLPRTDCTPPKGVEQMSGLGDRKGPAARAGDSGTGGGGGDDSITGIIFGGVGINHHGVVI